MAFRATADYIRQRLFSNLLEDNEKLKREISSLEQNNHHIISTQKKEVKELRDTMKNKEKESEKEKKEVKELKKEVEFYKGDIHKLRDTLRNNEKELNAYKRDACKYESNYTTLIAQQKEEMNQMVLKHSEELKAVTECGEKDMNEARMKVQQLKEQLEGKEKELEDMKNFKEKVRNLML